MTICLLGLGSNLGAPQDNLNNAVDHLRSNPKLRIATVSQWLATAPVGGPAGQQEYLNGALRLETDLAVLDLLNAMHHVEQRMGRSGGQRWGPRLIDLDLLLYGNQVVDMPTCRVPHPWLAIRRFVLQPAAEIAGEMKHPEIGLTIGRLMQHLAEATPILSIVSAEELLAEHFAEELTNQLSVCLVRQNDSTSAVIAAGASGSAESEPVESSGKAEWCVTNYWPTEEDSKLVVLLKSPDFEPDKAARHQQLLRRVRESTTPWLELSTADPQQVLHDLRAAMNAMQ